MRFDPICSLLLVAMAFASAASAAGSKAKTARVYYFSPEGNDMNDGLSDAKPIKSLEKVEGLPLQPGDKIVLAGGKTFTGSIVFPVGVEGTPELPIVLESDGKNPATIYSAGKPAIAGKKGGFIVRNLILKGDAKEEVKDYSGLRFWAVDKDGTKHKFLRFENLDISGFSNGLELGSADASHPGFQDVKITHINAHGNYGAAITSWDQADGKGYAHKDIYVADCDASHNLGGSGIILSGVNGAVAEYCRASHNEGKGGGVGIWAYYAKRVLFRYCIANDTRTGGGDGGGFDLDGGCVDCHVEHCLAYHNDGPGYMHCDYPGSFPTIHNQIARCWTINDGRKAKGDSIGFGFVTWGSGLDYCGVSDNVALVTISDPALRYCGVLFTSHVAGSEQASDVPHIKNCSFVNNSIYVQGGGVASFNIEHPKDQKDDIELKSNHFGYEGNGQQIHVEDGRVNEITGIGDSFDMPLPTLNIADLHYEDVQPRDLAAFFKKNERFAGHESRI